MQLVALHVTALLPLIDSITLGARSVAPCVTSALTSIEFVAGGSKSIRTHIQSPTIEGEFAPIHMQRATDRIASTTALTEVAAHHIKKPNDRVAPTRAAFTPLTSRDKGTIPHSNPGEPVVNSSHASTLNTLTRVQRFLDENGPTLGDINSSGYRVILDDAVDKLSAHAGDQTATKRVAAAQTAKERVLRNALKLNHMRPIATVAAAQLRQVPEFAALKMPATTSTSRGLIASATAMSKAAAAYIDAFVGAGLPPDFLDKLRAASDTLANTLTSRNANANAQRGATMGLDTETTRGREAVKVLNSLVEPLIAGNLPLLAQWTAAKRFGSRASLPTSASIDAAASGPTTSAARNAAIPAGTTDTSAPQTEAPAPSAPTTSSPPEPTAPPSPPTP